MPGYSSLLPFILILASAIASAETTRVYKIINPDGSVSYSDQPSSNAEAMDVQPVETVPAFRAPTTGSQSQPSSGETAKRAAPGYEQLSIQQPAHDTAFWSGNGDVMVAIATTPELSEYHRLRVILDGTTLMRVRDLHFTLPNVDRGTHQLEVQIIGSQDEIISATSSTFTLHRPSVLRRAN